MLYVSNNGAVAGRRVKTLPLSKMLASTLLSFSTLPVLAEETFNTSFIHGDTSAISALSSGDDILPGTYPFDIYLNGQRVDHKAVEFRKVSPEMPIQVCISAQDYLEYGVQINEQEGEKSDCFDLTRHLDGTKISYDASIQKIAILVPQIYLAPVAQGTLSPRIYDNGINAGFINYNFSGSSNHARSSDMNNNYYFVSTNSGLNLGDWRLRNNASWQKQSASSSQWRPIASWAETDIIPWRSRLQIGQRSTSNAVFNSFQFRGMQLASVTELLPDSLRGYAPVVRGIARTSARIEVRQNGYTVYSTNVAPGPFILNDIYPSTSSGDLHVTVFEADGAKQNFSVPFSSVTQMLREGIWDYALTAGKYQDGTTSYQPRFLQGTISRGLNHDVTPYGGVLVSEHYRSGVLGVGKSLGMLGAASFDTAWSDTELHNGDRQQGASFRFLYSKSINTLGTELQVAGYRYSTSGYYDFRDMVSERASYEDGRYRNEYSDNSESAQGVPGWADERRKYYYTDSYNNKRQRLELTLNQHIGPVSLYSSVTNQTYWGSGNRDRTLQVGMNGVARDISYGVFLQDSRSNYGQKDRNVTFTLSMPFTVFNDRQMTANMNLAHSKQSGDSYSTGVSGTLLDDSRLNYYLQTGHSRSGGQTSTADAGYMGSMGNAEAGYTQSDSYRQGTLNLSGGVLAHGGGVTLSQPLQNTIVLVEAKNASGVRLENQPGVAIDRAGYAVMTSAMAYRHNRVALRTEDIGAGLDVPLAAKDVVPTYGAISRVAFETRSGQSLLIRLQGTEGNLPAIGAAVFNATGSNVGTVGTNGSTFVSGVNSDERLRVKWGENAAESCWIALPAIESRETVGYQEINLACRSQ